MNALQQEYDSLKQKAMEQGWSVDPAQTIAYGIQFRIGRAGWSGMVRLFLNKKGQFKYDYSQLGESHETENVIALIEAIKGFKVDCDLGLPLIGCDESGKGDYFGPLVCAAVYVDAATEPVLRALGVRDCKSIPDSQIQRMAQKVIALVQKKYSVFILEPEHYNKIYKTFLADKKKLNHLLAWAHGEALQQVLKVATCRQILIDKFADDEIILNAIPSYENIEIHLYEQAERNIAVAAASVIARAAFLSELEKLSKIYHTPLLKGSSAAVLKQTRRFIEKHDLDTLAKVAKVHFKITQQALEFDF